MNILSILLLAVLAIGLTALLVTWAKGFHRPRRFLAANVAEGQSLTGMKPFFADVAFPTRFRLGKIGSGPTNITIVTAATDKPLAVMIDEAGIGDLVTGQLLGATVGTQKVALNSTVANGDALTPDATGYARTLPTADGTYWVFGQALQAGVAGDIIEFLPCYPKQIVYLTAVATTRL